ncbi:creatininase family protein [Oceanobacillus halotolerans]|uniref:creatininase family protein n=1 Tax=Oceanobacillus halotolerans TaxID=2663380 RepID=UPI0013DCA620|nr:creatininase family protein [Oceanobacillus halotolerans]
MAQLKHVWLQENKWEDVENYLQKKKTIIVPFGSVEQHAKHLPLGTDAFLSQLIAEDVAKKTNTLIAPPLWVGWAPHHMAYTGTITLRPETLTSMVEDMCESLIYHGFEKIILINGHREANLPPIKIGMTKVRNKTGAFMAIADPFYINAEKGKELSEVEEGGIGHAEELEASQMYHLLPYLCEPSASVKNIPSHHRFMQHDPLVQGDKMITASDVATYKEATKGIGVMGDATKANPEKGKAYHEAVVNNIAEFIDYCDGEVEVSLRNQDIPL